MRDTDILGRVADGAKASGSSTLLDSRRIGCGEPFGGPGVEPISKAEMRPVDLRGPRIPADGARPASLLIFHTPGIRVTIAKNTRQEYVLRCSGYSSSQAFSRDWCGTQIAPRHPDTGTRPPQMGFVMERFGNAFDRRNRFQVSATDPFGVTQNINRINDLPLVRLFTRAAESMIPPT